MLSGSLGVLIVIATLVAYANSFDGAFVLDDQLHIVNNERIRSLSPLSKVVWSHRRPVRNLTLALNYAVHGLDVWGYHLVNVSVHCLAALLLFGVVRRLYERACDGPRAPPTADCGPTSGRTRSSGGLEAEPQGTASSGPGSFGTLFAATVALLWAVHPLQTQSVTYIIQRDESMMGLFYLLLLYSIIRASDSKRPVVWYVLAIVGGALGAGTKAVIVTAPIVAIMFDRVFLARSWQELLRRRWGLYLVLSATIASVLAFTGVVRGVLDTTPRPSAGVGFGYQAISPWTYLLTQSGVLLRYLRLAFYPVGLCLDYDWPATTSLADAAWPGAVVVSLLAGTVYALVRKPHVGSVAAAFFLVLAPTSSIVPIKDVIFEHRMYLPLACVITLTMLAIANGAMRLRAARRHVVLVGVFACGVVALVLMALTVRRNAVYYSEERMWQDVLAKQPNHVRALSNYGLALAETDRPADAIPFLERALQLDPSDASAHNGLGIAHSLLGDAVLALRHFQLSIARRPKYVEPLQNAGLLLLQLGRHEEAMEYLTRAVRVKPRDVESRLTLGNLLVALGRPEAAAAEFERIIEIDPRHASAHVNLAVVVRDGGDVARAEALLQRAASLDPSSASPHVQLGILHMMRGDTGASIRSFRNATIADPADDRGFFNLGRALFDVGDPQAAVAPLRRALELNPLNAAAGELLKQIQAP